jgi:hypothetical protein
MTTRKHKVGASSESPPMVSFASRCSASRDGRHRPYMALKRGPNGSVQMYPACMVCRKRIRRQNNASR